MTNYREVSHERTNPLLPVIGFVVILLTGGLAYFSASAVAVWLTRTTWVLGATQVLPLSFPSTWSPDIVRLAVAAGMFLLVFVIEMILLFIVMGSARGPMDVSIGEMREEKKRRAKEIRRRSRR